MTVRVSVAVLAGDGIGKEVMPYALDALNIVAAMDDSWEPPDGGGVEELSSFILFTYPPDPVRC